MRIVQRRIIASFVFPGRLIWMIPAGLTIIVPIDISNIFDEIVYK